MEFKNARLTLLIDPNKKAAFVRLCAQQDRTASQVVRQLVRDYLAKHGAALPTGFDDEPAPAAVRARGAAHHRQPKPTVAGGHVPAAPTVHRRR